MSGQRKGGLIQSTRLDTVRAGSAAPKAACHGYGEQHALNPRLKVLLCVWKVGNKIPDFQISKRHNHVHLWQIDLLDVAFLPRVDL